MNTKEIGERTEGIILAEFLKRGYVVLLPFGDNQRYDMVIDDGGVFMRVQCKTARYKNGCVYADIASSYGHRGRGKRNYVGDVEKMALYCPEIDKVYIIPIDECPLQGISLRVEPTKNGQSLNIRWAKDYELADS